MGEGKRERLIQTELVVTESAAGQDIEVGQTSSSVPNAESANLAQPEVPAVTRMPYRDRLDNGSIITLAQLKEKIREIYAQGFGIPITQRDLNNHYTLNELLGEGEEKPSSRDGKPTINVSRILDKAVDNTYASVAPMLTNDSSVSNFPLDNKKLDDAFKWMGITSQCGLRAALIEVVKHECVWKKQHGIKEPTTPAAAAFALPDNTADLQTVDIKERGLKDELYIHHVHPKLLEYFRASTLGDIKNTVYDSEKVPGIIEQLEKYLNNVVPSDLFANRLRQFTSSSDRHTVVSFDIMVQQPATAGDKIIGRAKAVWHRAFQKEGYIKDQLALEEHHLKPVRMTFNIIFERCENGLLTVEQVSS
ncbi:MAG: hypothetical protein WCW27_03215 [Patescibacteria group bacterium]|jgi:hypothetical protein